MSPQYSLRRRWLYQSTHLAVAISTALTSLQGPCRRMTSVLYRPLMLSASALSYDDPTAPTDGVMPASASRSL